MKLYNMTQLNEANRKYISDFIQNNNPSKLPLVDLKARKTIKRDFNSVHNNEQEIVFYGFEGHTYSNAFCKINENYYILTYNFTDLVRYAHYVPGYED